MEIKNGYDPEKGRMIVYFHSNLIIDYYQNLKVMLDKSEGLPTDTTVDRGGIDFAVISFPISRVGGNVVKSEQINEDLSRITLALPKEEIDAVYNACNRFINAALRKLLKTTEFIPLEGYSVSSLQEDIKAAIANKRRLCIIDTYSSYLSNSKTGNYVYNQYLIPYGSNEWADVVLDIKEGNIKKLRKDYKGKLKITNWF